MSLTCLVAAFILLSNPMINVVDLLPDFIAWFLMIKAFSKLTYLSGRLAEASSNMLKLVWLTLARAFSIILIPQVDGTMILTVTLAFDVLEAVFVISAFSGAFDGISEISEIYDFHAAYLPFGKRKREHIVVAKKATVIFVLVKYVANVLPEFFELSGQNSIILPEGVRSLLTFKPLAYVFCFAVALIAAIVWLCIVIPLFKAIVREEDFSSKIDVAFEAKAVKPGIYRSKVISGALFMMAASGLFMFSVIFDSVDLVPTFIMPVVALVAIKKLSDQGFENKPAFWFTVSAVAVSAVAYVLKTMFATGYSYDAVKYSFEAYDSYLIAVSAAVTEAILLFVSYLLISHMVVSMVRSFIQTGSTVSEKAETAEVSTIVRKIRISCALFALACVFSVMSFVFAGDYPIIWLPALLVELIWFVQLCSANSSARAYVEDSILYHIS